jgi:hypothetical protein
MLRCFLFALIAFTFIATDANAFSHHPQRHYRQHYATSVVSQRGHVASPHSDGVGEVVAHPTDCPRTLFCGCGAARELGLSDRSLWLVKNWYQFPRASAAPGMAALWGSWHVAVIRAVHGDGTATVYDANSGAGLTRVHSISLAGLAIVDPHSVRGEPTFASFPPVLAAERRVAMRISYRRRAVARNASYRNWRAYHRSDTGSRQREWREARVKATTSFWH